MSNVLEPKRLNVKGRCCGRKPIAYKGANPRLFCPRCAAEFDPQTGKQRANWAYLAAPGGFVMRYAHMEERRWAKGRP